MDSDLNPFELEDEEGELGEDVKDGLLGVDDPIVRKISSETLSSSEILKEAEKAFDYAEVDSDKSWTQSDEAGSLQDEYAILKLPDNVQKAIDELMPKDDPMYRADFDVVSYINSIFPTEQSLANMDDVIAQVESQIQAMDTEVAAIIHSQASASRDGHEALQEAKVAIQELFTRIREIKQKTDSSEMMVKEITRDIKQLDTAKKNLTASITTLNHLHMLLGWVEQLEGLLHRREYGELNNLLPCIKTVLEHFDRYMHIPQVKELADKVGVVCQSLGRQVQGEFKDSVTGGRPFNPTPVMKDAAELVNVLEPSIKADLVTWFVQLQMSEYLVLFEDTQDTAWLDKVEQRYAWFKRFLVNFETKHNDIFPRSWDMPRQLAVEFCELTARELDSVMAKRKIELNAKLLQSAIAKTVDFESLLMKRFPQKPAMTEEPVSPTTTSAAKKPPFADLTARAAENAEGAPAVAEKHQFSGIIRQCFEPYLGVWIAAQDATLHNLIDNYVRNFVEKGPPRADAEIGAVNLQSAPDLFTFYRNCIVKAGEISLRHTLLFDLAKLFKKYLREYAKRCLTDFLPKISAASVGNTVGIIQSLLKEGDIPRLTVDELYKVCCILVTGEYCAETTKILQTKLTVKLGDEHRDALDMSQEQDTFYQLITSCVTLLVQDLEAYCDPALAAMSKKQWSAVEGVGDEGSYVVSIRNHIRQHVPRIRDYLFSSRKYFVQYCTKFATAFIPRFINAIAKCKPISLDGAEQLLLDAHAIKTELCGLPNVDSSTTRKPPTNYTKLVVKGMSKVEMMLKLVMSSEESPEAFVESFLRLLPDGTIHDFQQILELRGLRRMEQAALIEFYQKKTSAGSGHIGGQGSSSACGGSSLPPLTIGTAGGTQHGSGPPLLSPSPAAPLLASFLPPDVAMAHDSRIKKLEKLIKKRL